MPATPAIDEFTVISATTLKITVRSGSDTSHVQFDYSWTGSPGSSDYEVYLPTGQSTTDYVAIGSLGPGSYSIGVRARINSTASSWVSRGFTISGTGPDPGNPGNPGNPGKPKPDALGWSTKSPGTTFSLLASSWNNMTTKINAWRDYQGKGLLSFTTAYSGNDLTASMFNQVCTGISSLSPPLSAPTQVIIGETVTANKINRISESIDSLRTVGGSEEGGEEDYEQRTIIIHDY